MAHRFIELVVRARRLVTRTPRRVAPKRGRARLSARRDVSGDLTQISFRLAFIVDLAYVGIGALGGAAVGRAALEQREPSPVIGCAADSVMRAAPESPSNMKGDSVRAGTDTASRTLLPKALLR